MQNGGSSGTETKSHAQMLTFANLRIFEALARLASFSRAAEELRVSQPYVSAQIAALEARAGVQLFRRVGRRAHLTEAGRTLQDYAVRILAELEQAETSLSAIRGVVAGPLSIAATATPAASILPASLERFLAAYPAVTVSMRIFGSPDVERAVIEGRCELGVLVSAPETSGLAAESVGTDELVVVVSPAHPYGGRSQITADELAHERLLVREPSSGTRRFIESQFSSTGLKLQYGLELNNNEAIKALVMRNLGIAIQSRQAVYFELLAGNLKEVRVRGLPLFRELFLISCLGAKLGAAARAFRAVILAGSTGSSNHPESSV